MYLNTFPVSGGQSVLEPMAAAKPVVILRHREATHFNAGAELAGLEEVLADSEDGYLELATRFIKDAALRQEQSPRAPIREPPQIHPPSSGRSCPGPWQSSCTAPSHRLAPRSVPTGSAYTCPPTLFPGLGPAAASPPKDFGIISDPPIWDPSTSTLCARSSRQRRLRQVCTRPKSNRGLAKDRLPLFVDNVFDRNGR